MLSKDRILLPPRYQYWEANGWHMFFDPQNFCCVRVNSDGKRILEALEHRGTFEGAVREVVTQERLRYDGEVESSISKFVQYMLGAGFLHLGKYQSLGRNMIFPRLTDPMQLYLALTYQCNLQCSYCCIAGHKKTREPCGLSKREFMNVIDQAVDIGITTITITGGEPLLHPDILDIAAYGKRKGMRSVLLTNGTLIGRNNVDALASIFDGIHISLDSSLAQEHDALRGYGTFPAVVQAIKLLVRTEQTHITVKPVLTPINIGSYRQLLKFAFDDLGVQSVEATQYLPTKHITEAVSDPLLLPPGKLWEAVDLTAEYSKSKEVAVLLADYPMVSGVTVLTPRDECGCAHGLICVGPNGAVYPCQNLIEDEFICGNVTEKNLGEIYEKSETMKACRSFSVDQIEPCRDCDYKYLCSGGCRALAYDLYEDFSAYLERFCADLRTSCYKKLEKAAQISLSDITEIRKRLSNVPFQVDTSRSVQTPRAC